MAKLEAKITITGLEFTRDVVKKIAEETEFEDYVTEDYKAGFYSFGNATVNMLEALIRKGVENGESG